MGLTPASVGGAKVPGSAARPGMPGADSVCPGPPAAVFLPLRPRPRSLSGEGCSRGQAEEGACGTCKQLGAESCGFGPRCRSRGRGRKRAGLKRGGLKRGLSASVPAARLLSLPGLPPGRGRCFGPGQVRVGGGTCRLPASRQPLRLLRREEAYFWRSKRWLCPWPAVGPEGK